MNKESGCVLCLDNYSYPNKMKNAPDLLFHSLSDEQHGPGQYAKRGPASVAPCFLPTCGIIIRDVTRMGDGVA